MKVPNPNCPRNDCRYAVGVGMTTSMYYPPIYNKDGQNINPDGNVSSGELSCTSCNRKWEYKTQYGNTTYKEVPQQNPVFETLQVESGESSPTEESGVATITSSTIFITN